MWQAFWGGLWRMRRRWWSYGSRCWRWMGCRWWRIVCRRWCRSLRRRRRWRGRWRLIMLRVMWLWGVRWRGRWRGYRIFGSRVWRGCMVGRWRFLICRRCNRRRWRGWWVMWRGIWRFRWGIMIWIGFSWRRLLRFRRRRLSFGMGWRGRWMGWRRRWLFCRRRLISFRWCRRSWIIFLH